VHHAPAFNGERILASDGSTPSITQLQAAKALAIKSGITESQALDLVQALGFNHSSLVFHARELKRASETK
jgi:hypothetical protein